MLPCLVTDGEKSGFCVAIWQLGAAGAVGFVMLVTILILSVCLCRVCRRAKKQKRSEVATENLQEAELHYAELQNFLDSSRGQCDGGTCPAPPAAQTSDYATVAELKGSDGEAYVSQEENEDSGLDDGQKENELLEEQE
uniref:Uncharacterized protein n=1 Tax=Sphaerodactylus townsendi TaxID=933632 RepID=A0ACB8EG19_9SAUR